MAATISGDGTSTLINLTTSGNTVLGDASTDTLNVGNGGLVKDASGNVGIGTSSPARKFEVIAAGSPAAQFVRTTTATNSLQTNPVVITRTSGNMADGFGTLVNHQIQDDAGVDNTIGYYGFVRNGADNSGAFYVATSNAGTTAERARIDSSGRLLLGSSTVNANLGATGFQITSAQTCAIVLCTDATGQAMRFFSSTTTQAGFITVSGATATYNSASDYRLKENVTQLVGGLNVISKLKPVKYTWKVDGNVGEGFIAHELQESIPLAVQGVKDQVDANGDIDPQGIDQSKIVPYLVSAIQELKALVDTQASTITALQADVEALKAQ